MKKWVQLSKIDIHKLFSLYKPEWTGGIMLVLGDAPNQPAEGHIYTVSTANIMHMPEPEEVV